MEETEKILVLGSLIMDLSVRCRQAPREGETVYTDDDYQANPGGKGGNQAVAAARAGAEVVLLGRIADDDYGRALKESFHRDRIDTSRLITDSSAKTGTAFVWVEENGGNRCLCSLGVNGRNRPEDFIQYESLFQESQIVLTTLEYSKEVLDQVTKMAKQSGCLLIVDPSANDYSKLTPEIAERIDILKPNEVETEMLTGIAVLSPEDAAKAVKRLKEMGIKTPIVSMGSQGVVYDYQGQIIHEPGIEIQAVDTTAAGDTFIGSLAARLSLGKEFPEAVRYANRAASLCVQKKGAQRSIPFMEDVL